MQAFSTALKSVLLGIVLQVILAAVYGFIAGYAYYTGTCFNGDSTIPCSLLQSMIRSPVVALVYYVGFGNIALYGIPTIIFGLIGFVFLRFSRNR